MALLADKNLDELRHASAHLKRLKKDHAFAVKQSCLVPEPMWDAVSGAEI